MTRHRARPSFTVEIKRSRTSPLIAPADSERPQSERPANKPPASAPASEPERRPSAGRNLWAGTGLLEEAAAATQSGRFDPPELPVFAPKSPTPKHSARAAPATAPAKRVLPSLIAPPTLLLPVLSAYFGGRFECSHVGPIAKRRGRLTSWDIASAYPYAFAQLPCMKCSTWHRRKKRLTPPKDGALRATLYREQLDAQLSTTVRVRRIERPKIGAPIALILALAERMATAESEHAQIAAAHLLLAAVESHEVGTVSCSLAAALGASDISFGELVAVWRAVVRG